MSTQTSIEWTDTTWNPLVAVLTREITVPLKKGGTRTFPAGTRGWFCTKCSAGCKNCYAEKLNFRLGNGLSYSVPNLDAIRWELAHLDEPARWRKPQRVFVNSMTDLFHEAVPDELIDRVFAVMALTPQHTFQVLTKRAERMRRYFEQSEGNDAVVRVDRLIMARLGAMGRKDAVQPLPWIDPGFKWWPLANVWLGVSVEDQRAADERIPELLKTSAAIRFLSCEPLLGPVLLSVDPGQGIGVDWVIVGGESGPGARIFLLDHARKIVADCKAAGAPVFVKQLGTKPHYFETTKGFHLNTKREMHRLRLKDGKGGDMAEWPEDLRVREFPR